MARIYTTPFEATLVLSREIDTIPATETVTNDRGGLFRTPEYQVVRPAMPTPRRVSIEEFEADMRAARNL